MRTYSIGHIDTPPVVINSLNLHTMPIPKVLQYYATNFFLRLNTIYIEMNVSVITLTEPLE